MRTHLSIPSSWLLWLTLLVLLPLSLIDFPYNSLGAILREFSNLGHVVFFAILAYLLLRIRRVQESRVGTRILLLLLAALLLGGGIELAQSMTSQREPSLMDLIRDLAGSSLIIVCAMPQREQIRRWQRYSTLTTVILIILYDSLLPSLRLYDRQLAAQQFPILSNLEYQTEALRWSGGQLVQNPVREGSYALKVDFSREEYSAVSMNYLPSDWRGFDALRFSIYNPEDLALMLNLKIHDRLHRQTGLEYSDRFNRSLSILPGWNDFSIPLSDIESAPETRHMAMDEISMLQFFTHALSNTQSLYLDAIELARKKP